MEETTLWVFYLFPQTQNKTALPSEYCIIQVHIPTWEFLVGRESKKYAFQREGTSS